MNKIEDKREIPIKKNEIRSANQEINALIHTKLVAIIKIFYFSLFFLLRTQIKNV